MAGIDNGSEAAAMWQRVDEKMVNLVVFNHTSTFEIKRQERLVQTIALVAVFRARLPAMPAVLQEEMAPRGCVRI